MAFPGTTLALQTPVKRASERDWPTPCQSPPPGTSSDQPQVSGPDGVLSKEDEMLPSRILSVLPAMAKTFSDAVRKRPDQLSEP